VTGRAGPARPSQPLGPARAAGPSTGTGAGRSTRLGRPGPADGPGFRAARPERVTATGGSWRVAHHGMAKVGRRWGRWGMEGGNRFPHQGPIRGSCLLPASWQRRDRTLEKATGQRRPGSHRDGPEACSPGEAREDTRSLDGRFTLWPSAPLA
jgi:hypothetical protein